MSNIDIQRLINEPEYWDKVAPEGAEYYSPREFIWHEGWYRHSNGEWEFCSKLSGIWNRTTDAAFNDNNRTMYKKPTRNLYENDKSIFDDIAKLCVESKMTVCINPDSTFTVIDDRCKSLDTDSTKTVLTILKKKKQFLDEMNNWDWN